MSNSNFNFSYAPPAILQEERNKAKPQQPEPEHPVPEEAPSQKVYCGEPLYITDQEIREILDISQVTLWRWTTKLGFPKPIPGTRGRRPYAEFMAWVKERGMA